MIICLQSGQKAMGRSNGPSRKIEFRLRFRFLVSKPAMPPPPCWSEKGSEKLTTDTIMDFSGLSPRKWKRVKWWKGQYVFPCKIVMLKRKRQHSPISIHLSPMWRLFINFISVGYDLGVEGLAFRRKKWKWVQIYDGRMGFNCLGFRFCCGLGSPHMVSHTF